jgi:hypothetical protein
MKNPNAAPARGGRLEDLKQAVAAMNARARARAKAAGGEVKRATGKPRRKVEPAGKKLVP